MAKGDPKFNIPVSNSPREIDYKEATMVFDTPYAFHEEHPDRAEYEVWYYTVDVKGEQQKLTAYKGLHNAIESVGYAKGATLSFGRIGEGKSTVWDVAYVDGPKQTAAVRPLSNGSVSVKATAPWASKEWSPLSSEARGVMLSIMDDDLSLLEEALALVSVRPLFNEVSLDQKVRIAVGLRINAGRVYKPGMKIAGQTANSSANDFLADLDYDDDIVEAVTEQLIVYTGLQDKDEVISTLIGFGINSALIKSYDDDGLRLMYNLCSDFASAVMNGSTKEEALSIAAEANSFAMPSVVPW